MLTTDLIQISAALLTLICECECVCVNRSTQFFTHVDPCDHFYNEDTKWFHHRGLQASFGDTATSLVGCNFPHPFIFNFSESLCFRRTSCKMCIWLGCAF